jgi:tetratricopeptide (TPR) repeat protein
MYANWAVALTKSNQLGEAREKYELALALEPNDLDLLRDAARVDVQLNDPARAVERLRRALEIEPDDADAAYLLASVTALQGGDSAALFARARALDPRRTIVAVQLARSLARQRRDREATSLLERLLALAPPEDAAAAQFVTSAVHTQLGEIALDRGDAAAGIQSLDRALAIWPENYDAKKRLAFQLATSPDPALRDPRRAVALAESASAERREFASLSTLARGAPGAGARVAGEGHARDRRAPATDRDLLARRRERQRGGSAVTAAGCSGRPAR